MPSLQEPLNIDQQPIQQGFNTGIPGAPNRAGVCAGCGVQIKDQFYLLTEPDKHWHYKCLKCSCCQENLNEEHTCYFNDGIIYCKADFARRHKMKRCARCDIGIFAHEFVMRQKGGFVFHVNCFSCLDCNKLMQSGDLCGIRDGLLFCGEHYDPGDGGPMEDNHPSTPAQDFMPHPPQHQQQPEPMGENNTSTPPHDFMPHHPPHPPPHQLQAPAQSPYDPRGLYPEMYSIGGDPGMHLAPSPTMPFYNGVGAVQKGRPRKKKSPMHDHDQSLHGLEFGLDPNDPNNPHDPFYQYSRDLAKQKRMRTSFKHHQLRAMRAYFAINHNPDAKDLKSLSEKTGLPKKVLQVWFQNARAKNRRLMQKKDGSNNNNNNEGSKGQSPKEGEEAGKLPADMPDSPFGHSDHSSNMSDMQSSSLDSGHGAPNGLGMAGRVLMVPHGGHIGGPQHTQQHIPPVSSLSDLFSSINTTNYSDYALKDPTP